MDQEHLHEKSLKVEIKATKPTGVVCAVWEKKELRPPLQDQERARVYSVDSCPKLPVSTSKTKRAFRSERRGAGEKGRDVQMMGGRWGGRVSFCGLQGEGQLGSGLAPAQDDFLLLLLLLLTVLLQLHALLVDLSLLLHDS